MLSRSISSGRNPWARTFLGSISLLALSLAAATQPAQFAGIPLIDVSSETARIVTVDREAGQYLGHPTTVLMPDGRTIFAVYPKGHAAGALVLKRSDDGGLTWSERLAVPENWQTSVNPPSINRLVGPDGKERLVILTGSKENNKEDVPVRQAISEDGGRSWTPLREIGQGRDYAAIVVASGMLRLKDGSYMAVQHSVYTPVAGGASQRAIYKMLSRDGGLSWSAREVVTDLPGLRLCEPGVIRSPNGKQIAVLLRENTRTRNSFVVFSEDEGHTWGAPRELPLTLTGDKHIAKYAPDGRLLVALRDVAPESPTRGHFIVWVGHYDDLVQGRPGQYRAKLLHNHARMDCGYAGLELLPDATFVATTYGRDRPEEDAKHAVVSIRFKLAELDARLAAQR